MDNAAHKRFNMANVRSVGTFPEMVIQYLLTDLGIPYLTNVKELPGTPDIYIPSLNISILIHGCFWHGHKGCRFFRLPKSNLDYWCPKIERTQLRDILSTKKLRALKIKTIVIWECEIKNTSYFSKILKIF